LLKYLFELTVYTRFNGCNKNKQMYEKSTSFPILFAFFRSHQQRAQKKEKRTSGPLCMTIE